MAGTSYRGLTIRIGGDVTKLTKALSTANKAITATQAQLRRLNQAAKFDPGNDFMSDRLVLIRNKAEEVATRLTSLRTAMTQLGSTDVGGRSVADLAETTKDAALEAERAREKFNKVDQELEVLYRKFFDMSGTKTKELFSDSEINTYVESLKRMGGEVAKDAERFFELKDAWGVVAGELRTADMVAQFTDLQSETTRATAEAQALGKEFAELKLAASVPEEVKRLDAEMERLSTSANLADDYMEQLDKALELDPNNINLVNQKMELLEAKTQLAAEMLATADQKLDAFSDDVKNLAGSKGIVELAEGASKAKDAFAKQEGVVKQLKGALNDAKREADNLAKEGKENTSAYQRAASRVDDLERALSSAEQKAEELGNEAATYQGAVNYRETTVEVERLAGAYAQAQDAQEKFGAVTGEARLNLADLAQSVSQVVVPALKRLADYSIDAANQVDGAFRDMRKTVNATEEQYEKLRDAAQEFSTTHYTSADEMLEIMAMGGQLGIAAENLQAFAETISQIGIATNVETMDAAQNLGQLMNIMDDLDTRSADQFADALVRLGNNMPALEGDIMNITTRIASQSNIIGLTTPQVLAWSTAIASTGQKSEAAGTAISKTMVQIESAVASGGDDLELFASVARMSAEDFAAAWENDPNTALRNFIAGLTEIDDSGDSMIMKLEELGITGVRQKQTIEGLSQTLDVLDDALLMSQDAWDGVSDSWGDAGDAAREAERKAEGFSGTLQELKNSAQVLGAEVGESLTPYLAVARDVVKGLYERFDGLNDRAKTFSVTLAAVAAAALPAAAGVLRFSAEAEDATTWQHKLVQSATNLFSGADISKIAAGGAITVALSLLAIQAEAAYDEIHDLNRITKDLGDIVDRTTTPIYSASDAFEELATHAGGARETYGEFLDKMADHVDDIERSAESYEQQASTLALAQEYLDQYMNQTGLTAEEQGKLVWAIDQVNEMCGTELSVVDQVNGKIEDQNGILQTNVDKIDAVIEARKREFQLNALLDQMDELNAAEMDAQNHVQELHQQLQDLGNVEPWVDNFGVLHDPVGELNDELSQTYATIDEIHGQQADLAEAIGLVNTAMENGASSAETWALWVAQGYSPELMDQIYSLGGALDDLGVNMDSLTNLSSEDANVLVTAWLSGSEDLRDILDRLGVEYENHADDAESAMITAGGATAVYRSAFAKLPGEIDGETRKVKRKLEDNLNQERNASNWAARTMSAYKSALNTNIDVSGVKAKLQQLDMSDRSYTWGSHLIGNLAAGMRARLGELDMVSKTAASKISNKLGQTVAKEGPLHYTDVWGVHLMDNIISGMESRQDALERASLASAEIISDAMDVESRLAVPTMAEAPVTSLQGVVQGGNTVYINGAQINDTPAIQEATKVYLMDMARLGAM